MSKLPGEYTFYPEFDVTDDVKKTYDDLGFIIVRNLLDKEELGLLKKNVEDNPEFRKAAFKTDDGANRKANQLIWKHPGSDVSGMVARSEKVAGVSTKLAGGEVYHYHTKMIMKAPFEGGQHSWHQDYGYWYHNGCLRPDLISVFIAYDKCTRDNGCLQVVKGSHKCGRIDHSLVGGQTGADMKRVKVILEQYDELYLEMEPGDALFFHSNVLHYSGQNSSPTRRWSFICCYCRADNNPVYEHYNPQYTPLDIVPNSAIKECRNFTDLSGKVFRIPEAGVNKNYVYDPADDK